MKYTGPQRRIQTNPGSEEETRQTSPQRRSSEAETNVNTYEAEAQKIRQMMERGLPEGNVELAAIMGHMPSQVALGRPIGHGMRRSELFDLLLRDPNLKVTLDVGR
jgi:hypothetical protein